MQFECFRIHCILNNMEDLIHENDTSKVNSEVGCLNFGEIKVSILKGQRLKAKVLKR